MQDIILGRLKEDQVKWGTRGTIFLGKQYIKMGQVTSLANKVYLDIATAHSIFICGKRGGGKSYTMGVIAEGLAELDYSIKKMISIILFDTMGIYWTMKYGNTKEESILREWNLKAHPLEVTIYTPTGYHNEYKEKGIPTDKPFSIRPSELSTEDWFLTFDVTQKEEIGVLIERIILQMKENFAEFSIDDIVFAIKEDKKSELHVREAAINRFQSAKAWGVFSKEGTPITELSKGGEVTVLDVSCYATMPGGLRVKSLVIGIVSQKLFQSRMIARREEEFKEIHSAVSSFDGSGKEGDGLPLIWLVIDEAHEFMPLEGKTSSTDALITIIREGRQPGISLILASQQPGKINTDVMTQSDLLISHRITAKLDTDALGMLMQSYMREGLDVALNNLPRLKGSALIVDDANERLYPIRIKPRISWHGGGSPTALREEKEEFNLQDF